MDVESETVWSGGTASSRRLACWTPAIYIVRASSAVSS